MKKITSFIVVFLTTIIPVISFARAPQDFRGVIVLFINLLLKMLPIVFGLAILVFWWGLAKFILKAGDESAREEGKQIMKWGIVALFVIVSMWGIIGFLRSEFSITGDGNFPIPRL